MLNASNERAVLLDRKGVVLATNKAFAASHHMSVPELVGRCIFDLFPKDLIRGRRAVVAKVLRSGKPAYHKDTRDGRQVIAHLYPIRGGKGTVESVAVFASDVTESVAARKERGAAVELLQLTNAVTDLHNLVQEALGFFKRHSGCDAVGLRVRDGDDFPYYETKGFSKDFVLAETRLCALDPQGRPVRGRNGKPALECMCGNVLQGRFDPSKPFFTPYGSFWTSSTTELLATTDETDRQGRTRNRCNRAGYESVALIPLKCGGEILGLLQMNDRREGRFDPASIARYERLAGHVAIALAHRQSLLALSQSEARYRALVETIPAVTYTAALDEASTTLYVSPQIETLIGYTPQEYREADTWRKRLHPDDRDRVLAEVIRAHETGKPLHLEYRMVARDGRTIWVQDNILPVKDPGGKPIYTQGVMLDITAQKRREEETLRHQQHIQALVAELGLTESRERRRLAGGLHDHVGQSLALAKLRLDVLRRAPNATVPASHLDQVSDLLDEAARGMWSTISDLAPPALYETGLKAALEKLVKRLAEQQPATRFTFNGPRQSEALDERTRVALFETAREVIVNAVRHAKARNLKVSMRERDGRVQVRVQDDGVGFDVARVLSQVEGPGGFGLLNVRERLAYLGGNCNIKSMPGQGTDVILTVPYGEGARAGSKAPRLA